MIAPDGQATIAIVDRPFAVAGRAATADLPIASPGASLRHVYFHLHSSGLFAVDLVSRTGTRFDDAPAGSHACWIRPGRGLGLAGHRIELIEATPGVAPRGEPPRFDLLAEAGRLPGLELRPEDEPGRPVTLLSELSFLGRSRACAVRVDGEQVARVHVVIVRSGPEAFLINLGGPGVTVNGEAPGLVAPLRHGDRFTLGRSRFRVARGSSPGTALAALGGHPGAETPLLRAPASPPAGPEAGDVSRALHALSTGQDDLIRTNDQFQQALVAAVRQLYQEQTAQFERHFERLDRLQHEVAELRAELRERLDPSPLLPPPPDRPSPPSPAALPSWDRDPSPSTAPDSGRATSWLIDRLGSLEEQVEQETRSGWRDLLARLRPRNEA